MRSDFLQTDWGMLRRSRCAQIFPSFVFFSFIFRLFFDSISILFQFLFLRVLPLGDDSYQRFWGDRRTTHGTRDGFQSPKTVWEGWK